VSKKPAVAEKIKLTVNGKSVEVKTGTTILKASIRAGFYIPTLCYLDKLNPIGSCRICSVEVEGVDGMIMSCKTPVEKGMKVTTESEKITKYRQDMMRMILVEHPRDCPVCERSGECSLQNKTYELDVKGHDWAVPDFKKVDVVDWGLIQYDQNLCIMCERCIKVCREVQGVAAYKIDGHGFDSKINTVTGEKLDCDFCGQCISVCPVGALSSGIYFSGRSWEMKKTETICPHCGVGCTLEINTKKGKVVRITSNDSLGVNEGNLCSRGRFGFEFIQDDSRIDSPLTRTGHGFKATEWDVVLKILADKFSQVKALHGGSAFVGIGSERASNEANYVFQKFFRSVLESGNIDNIANMTNPDVCSKRFEAHPDFPMTIPYDEIGEHNLFVYIGANGSNENPVIANMIRKANKQNGSEVVIAYSKEGTFLPAPRLQMPYDYREMAGFLNNTLSAVVDDVNKNGVFEGGMETGGFSAVTSSSSLENEIAEFVTLTRKRGKPLYLIGQEAQRHPDAGRIIGNIVNLAKLTGGSIMVLREYTNSLGVNDMGVAPNVRPGYKKEESANLQSNSSIINQMESGKIKVLILLEEDALSRYYNSERLLNAMKKVDFILVIDQFYNKTCLSADMVLPSATSIEKDGTFTNIEGRIQRVSPAIEHVNKSKSAWEIFDDIASAMGGGLGFDDLFDVQDEIAKEVSLYADIKDDESLVDYKSLISGSPSLNAVAPGSSINASQEYTLLRDSSLYSLGLYTNQCPSLRQLAGRQYIGIQTKASPYLQVNPDDAQKIGAKDGDVVDLTFGLGDFVGEVRLNSAVKEGSLRMPAELDISALKSIKINGNAVKCVNLAGMRG